jgi:hypothetical protein
MSPDEELVVIFGALHLAALVLGGVLFLMFLRSDTSSTWQPPDDEDGGGGGGGGNDRRPAPRPRPTGGIPLLDAEQSRHRLRGPGRITERRILSPARRPAHAPLPSRTPVRSR